jgi:hypothetical protein
LEYLVDAMLCHRDLVKAIEINRIPEIGSLAHQ